MRFLRARIVIYRVLQLLSWVAGALVVLVGASLKSNPDEWAGGLPVLANALRWSQQYATFLIPGSMIATGVFRSAKRFIHDPWVLQARLALLEQLREVAFEDRAKGEPIHFHRITIFKKTGFRFCLRLWPWSGWLVPVMRTGHTTLRLRTAFLAPDDADKAEGVAGMTWATRNQVRVSGLPDLSKGPPDTEITAYAEATFVSPCWIREWMKNQRFLARSFHGIPIEVKNRLWGVVVLDSRSPDEILKKGEKLLDLVGRSLGKLLEKE